MKTLKHLPRFDTAVLAIVVLGLFGIALMLYNQKYSAYVFDEYYTYSTNEHQARQDLLESHRLLEEYLGGDDPSIRIETIMKYLNSTLTLIYEIREHEYSSTYMEFINILDQSIHNIEKHKIVFIKRIKIVEGSDPGSEIMLQFHKTYRESLLSLDKVIEFTKEHHLEETKKLKIINLSIIALWMAIIVGLSVKMHSHMLSRRKAEEALSNTLKETQTIIDSNPDIFYTHDMEGRLVKWNRGLENLTGMTHDELMLRPAIEFVCEEDRPLVMKRMKEVFEKGKSTVEARFLSKDGSLIPYLCNGVILKNDNGDIVGFTGSGRNMTKRKKVEEERERTLHDLGERMKELKCLYWITSLTSQHGKSLAEIFQETADTIPGGMQYPEVTCARITYQGLKFVSCVDCGNCAFIETEWVLSADIIALGDSVGSVEIYYTEDKTAVGEGPFLKEEIEMIDAIVKQLGNAIERRWAEDGMLDAKEKAEDATKLKDKFVSLVVHDIKTPFAAIMGMLQFLKRDKEHPLQGEQKKIINNILKAGQNLVKMTDDLLQISRLQTGSIVPQRKFIDVHVLCVKAISGVSFFAKGKGIKLVNKLPVGTRIYADASLLEEVMNNLMSNAVKFCKKGDSITLFSPDNQKSIIAVKDTGVGIIKEKIPVLFKHEVKTSTPGTAKEIGTGLGLPLSNDIIKSHNGSIKVESEVGKGSTFYVELPHIRPKVFVVDDEEAFRVQHAIDLKPINVEIFEANNGQEVLRLLEDTIPDLIITDIKMPIMDGFELIKHLKDNPNTRSIPIIAASIDHTKEVREKAFQLGASDFVRKPIDPDVLLPRISRFFL